MLLTIEHHTKYHYDTPVDYTIQQLRLTPQDGFGQRVKRWDVRVNGKVSAFSDTYGNLSHTLVVDNPHSLIHIIATGEVETEIDLPPQDNLLPLPVFLRYTALTSPDAELRNFAQSFQDAGKTGVATLTALMHGIRDKVAYQRGSTGVATSAAEAFKAGVGVCQDHAHIFIACCRSLGIPARYVSGYLYTADGGLVESHAWADAWLEDASWHSFDVSNGQRTNGIHVRLATGLDYRDACPVSGIRRGGGDEAMSVQVQVQQTQQAQQ